jgi:predicted nucleotidyltransferase
MVSQENLFSQRTLSQFESFNNYREEVEKVLKKYEELYGVVIFYASEVGSRGLGINVEESDFDIAGFFVPKDEMDYYKIFRKFGNTIRITQEKIKINDKFYDLDLDIWDMKEWLRMKVTKNLTGCDFWFESLLIYRNLYPEIIKDLKKFVSPPFLLYWGKSKSGIGYAEKDLKNKGYCLTKCLMNVLTNLFHYFHYQIFLNFPIYNILDEIDMIRNNKTHIISKGIYDEGEFQLIEKSIELYLNLFEEKKIARKNVKEKIPEAIYDLMKLIESKYNTHKKKYELEILLQEEKAQEIFEGILGLNKSMNK